MTRRTMVMTERVEVNMQFMPTTTTVPMNLRKACVIGL
jgi:hypothetical protein